MFSKFRFKGTVNVISSGPPCKHSSAWFRNLYLINIGKEIFVFLGLKVFTSDNSYMFRAVEMRNSLKIRRTTIKNNSELETLTYNSNLIIQRPPL